MALTDPTRSLIELVASNQAGVLVTIKSDGRPQLSNISYHYYPDTTAATKADTTAGETIGQLGLIKVSITADRAKYRNWQRDRRVSLHVTTPDFWSYAVVEGEAECSAVASEVNDPAVDELVELFRDLQGEHPDWDEYRRAMVADRRVVLRLPITRVYGIRRPT